MCSVLDLLRCLLKLVLTANPINKNDSSTEKYEEWIHKKERFLEDDQLIDLIKQCLMHNPKQRPRKENLIYHNFFQPNCSTE